MWTPWDAEWWVVSGEEGREGRWAGWWGEGRGARCRGPLYPIPDTRTLPPMDTLLQTQFTLFFPSPLSHVSYLRPRRWVGAGYTRIYMIFLFSSEVKCIASKLVLIMKYGLFSFHKVSQYYSWWSKGAVHQLIRHTLFDIKSTTNSDVMFAMMNGIALNTPWGVSRNAPLNILILHL